MRTWHRSPQRAGFIFVFVTLLIDMLGFGIVMPVFPKLVVQLQGGDAAAGAVVFGAFGSVWALMQFVSGPLLGSLSDRFGRRPVVLLSTLGLGLDYLLMAAAPNLALLFVGRVISGITSANMATSGAYIADVTAPEQRADRFGKLSVAFGAGFIIGPALGGLLGSVGPRVPFWFAAALSLVNFAYGLFVLPESLPASRRAPFRLRAANPVGALALLRSRPGLLSLATAGFLAYIAHDVLPSTFVLYTGYRYAWDARATGICMMLVGAASIVVQGFVVGRVVAALGERAALATGLLIGLSGLVVYGLAPTAAVFALGIPLYAMFGLVSPALLALMSSGIDEREQGRLQGAMSSVRSMASLIAPILFTAIYALAIGDLRDLRLPGAAFLLGALLLMAALAVTTLSSPAHRRPAPAPAPHQS